MSERYPLTVYFDASCGLCRSEMQAIKAHDELQVLMLADCSSADFDDTAFVADGITRADMMACLHVCDAHGVWIKGVSAFELLYQSVGQTGMASLWGGRLTRPIIERVYPWVARHRRMLSWMGFTLLFELWGRRAAKRAYQRSRRCHEGKCSI